MKLLKHITILSLSITLNLTTGHSETESSSGKTLLGEWWQGKGAAGSLFGVRDELADWGFTLGGGWRGQFFGVVDGGIGGVRGGFFDEEIKFSAELDFAKLWKAEALSGWKAFGEVRWRDGLNPNLRAGAFRVFQPSDYQGGKQWRLSNFGSSYTAPEMFGVKEFLSVTGGWLQPQKFFVQQPLSKLFVNNAVNSSKGLGGNIPFSSSFSSWGGVVTIKPREWHYARAGFFMAYPEATSTRNHGLAFAGNAQNPSQTGLFVMAETGFTPKLGPSSLPGKYVFGGYSYGQWNTSYRGARYPNLYGFYWQADQMLWREPTAEVAVRDDKSGKMILAPAGKISDQGLHIISLLAYAPKYNNIMPFYFHTGLIYKGLLPTRDNDQTMCSFALGQYSVYNIRNLQAEGTANQPNSTAVLEFGHRVQLNSWAYIQPFLQYIIKPNGTNTIENTTILGMTAGVNF